MRLLRFLLLIALLAGCTAVGAQEDTTPTTEAPTIEERVADLEDLIGDDGAWSVTFYDAQRRLIRAAGQFETLDNRVTNLNNLLLTNFGSLDSKVTALEAEVAHLEHVAEFLLHHPTPLRVSHVTAEFSDAAVFRWTVSKPSASGVSIDLPEIEGYAWDQNPVSLAADRTGSLQAIIRPGADSGTEGQAFSFRPTVTGWGLTFEGHTVGSFHRGD